MLNVVWSLYHQLTDFSSKNPNNKIQIAQISRKILQYSLLWPKDDTELNPGLEYKMKIFSYFLITGLTVSSISIEAVLIIQHNKPINAEHMAAIVASLGTYYTVCCYLRKQHQIALLLRDISNFEYFGTPPGFHRLNKRLNLFAILLIAYVSLATTFYVAVKYLEKPKCEKIHIENGLDANHCGLIAPIWMPFPIDYFPVFQLTLLYGYVATLIHIKMSSVISFLCLEVVRHIILKMKHLKSLILSCFDHEDYEESYEKLRICIAYHLHILDLTARVDKTFSAIMFAHLALTSSIFACLEKQIIDGENMLLGSLHLFGWILALFIGCLAGQYLIDAGEIIPQALYDSKWYQADVRLRKSLLLMLVRSQKKSRVSAGPVGTICYSLFVSVLKASYSILCVLKS